MTAPKEISDICVYQQDKDSPLLIVGVYQMISQRSTGYRGMCLDSHVEVKSIKDSLNNFLINYNRVFNVSRLLDFQPRRSPFSRNELHPRWW